MMQSILGLASGANYSFFAVPAAFLATCIAPHGYAILSARKHYDNARPRTFNEAVANDEEIEKPIRQRILRAQAASDNGIESFGYFASGVVAANMAGLSNVKLNLLTYGYVLTRISYIVVYIHMQENRKYHFLRSTLWETAFSIVAAMWVMAGLNIMNK